MQRPLMILTSAAGDLVFGAGVLPVEGLIDLVGQVASGKVPDRNTKVAFVRDGHVQQTPRHLQWVSACETNLSVPGAATVFSKNSSPGN